MRARTALVFLFSLAISQDDRQANSYLVDCRAAMDRQLASSHIRNASCQKVVSEAYCQKLLAVERPQSFNRTCPIVAKFIDSPSYAFEGHVPRGNATDTNYRRSTHIPLAILILIFYQKLVPLTQQLVQELWDVRHSFLLHIDAKADAGVEEQMHQWVESSDTLRTNVHIRREIDVKRSGLSLLTAELFGLRELLRLSSSWKYFLVLSDSDQLLRPATFLQRFLALHEGESFVNTEVLGGKPRSIAVECQERVHSVRMGGHEEGIPTRPRLTLASGSQFVVLHRNFAAYAATARSSSIHTASYGEPLNLPSQVLREVQWFASPDETFFHTLAVNSEFCISHSRHNFHFHDTKGNILDEASRSYTDFPTGSPPTLAEAQLPLLLEVRSHQPIIFARKFDPLNASSMLLLERLTELKRQRQISQLAPIDAGEEWASSFMAAVFNESIVRSFGQAAKKSSSSAVVNKAIEVKGVEQMEHQSDSVYDITPAVYALQMQVRNAADFSENNGFVKLAFRDASTDGIVWLHENMAVPGYPERNSSEGVESTRFSPLVWMRVGAGWDMQRFRFAGAVSIISTKSAAKLGLSVVAHWRPCEAARDLETHWIGPYGKSFTVAEKVPPWSLLSTSRAPFSSTPELGWWSVEMIVKRRSPSDDNHFFPALVGTRRFFIFKGGDDIPVEAFKLFFHSATALPGEASRQLLGRPSSRIGGRLVGGERKYKKIVNILEGTIMGDIPK